MPPGSHARQEELARGRGEGWRVPPAAAGVDKLLEELPEERRRWIAARLAPHPLATRTQPIRLMSAAAMIPTTYVRCTVGSYSDDEDTRRQVARIHSEPSWRYRELAESHLAPWTAPRAVADLLLEPV